MSIRFLLLWVGAVSLAGGVSARAVENPGEASVANPMRAASQAATEPASFDFAASPLGTQPILQFGAAAPAVQSATAAAKERERAAQSEDGPAVIPLPPAAWTGAVGLLVLGVALTLRRRLHARH